MSEVMKMHPQNGGFEWIDHEGPYRLLDEEQVRQYDEQGFLVIEDVFDADTLASLIADFDPAEAEFEAVIRDQFGGKAFIVRAGEITFTTHLVRRFESARAFTRSAFFCDLVHDLLGPDVRLYWDQAVYKKPGMADPFPWHQDNGYTYIEPQQYLTCWVALTDADTENGCPIVAPGVHRRGTLAHRLTDLGFQCFEEPPCKPVVAPVRAGGVVIFSSLTPHKTGPNSTQNRHRKAYIVQFAPDGAEVIRIEGEDEIRTPCNAEDRQFRILTAGQIVG
ncbi:MAG: phytanoyl-CoA dioxygenase family protein [Deltaproteobacteria bacterium]|nr:phytanoyl-CoA dioxygenase family protein [Deltaproteobacteria bacterium]MBW2697416.1 phytanoyl-CoA dioxygenase family protein [Deltaproteobacteria bacterium]